MINYLPWIVDGVCFLFLLVGFIIGWRRGFASRLLRLFSWAIAIVLTVFLYQPVSSFMGTIGVTDKIALSIEEKIPDVIPLSAISGPIHPEDETGATVNVDTLSEKDGVTGVINAMHLPQSIGFLLQSLNTHEVYKALGVDHWKEFVASALARLIVNAISIIAIFVISLILLIWLSKKMTFVNKIPIIGLANQVLGGVCSVITAGLFLSLAFFLIMSFGAGSSFMAPVSAAMDQSISHMLFDKLNMFLGMGTQIL